MIYRSWFLQIFCLSNNCNHHTTTQFEKSQFGALHFLRRSIAYSYEGKRIQCITVDIVEQVVAIHGGE